MEQVCLHRSNRLSKHFEIIMQSCLILSRLVDRISKHIILVQNSKPNTDKKVSIGNLSKFEKFPEYDT
jgi:hypothetical protein